MVQITVCPMGDSTKGGGYRNAVRRIRKRDRRNAQNKKAEKILRTEIYAQFSEVDVNHGERIINKRRLDQMVREGGKI